MIIPITEFHGKYSFLSNFWTVPYGIALDGENYPTVEHAFQAAKTDSRIERHSIQRCMTPGGAKRAGRNVHLRKDWEEVKVSVMLDLLRQKFSKGYLREQLLETGDAELVEDNWWGDVFWGKCEGVGENHLGKLLMQVREEIKKEKASEP